MRIQLRTLRKIIQESISQDQKKKLEELFGDFNRESYHQAWELWNTLDPGTCPYPAPEEFFGANGEPLVMELFSETIMSMEDPVYFDKYCGVEWVDPKESLSFEFDFPFVCNEDADGWNYEEEGHYVVSGVDQRKIVKQIEQELAKELSEITEASSLPWWGRWREIKVLHISGQDFITSMGRGHCSVLIRYK